MKWNMLYLLWRPLFALFTFLLAMLALPALAQQQAPVHRLILKDGSYQLVTQYEVKGDRVHYYSSEREDWEDLPSSLVDWPATEKYEQGRTTEAPEAVQLDKELDHENELAEAKLPQVAPGLRIPEDSGVFLLDNFESQPQLLELHPAEGDVDQQSKGNIFRDAITPIAGLKAVIQIEGAHAAIQAHVEVPSLYLNIDAPPDPAELAKNEQAKNSQPPQTPISDRYRILRVEIKGNKRILGNLKRQVSGKVTQEQHLMQSTTTQLAGGWLKLTPSEGLAPGEYAVVEMMEKEGMNLYVYDFGINPKAPANLNPWKPEIKPSAPKTNNP
jgi:hypothetical protein